MNRRAWPQYFCRSRKLKKSIVNCRIMSSCILKRKSLIEKFRFVRRRSSSHARVFSGIQPTGALHLGNLFGAVRRWVELQDSGCECIYSIVDLHSITLPQDPNVLRDNIRVTAACLLSCGIDPEKSILFLQSQIPEHTELSWILGCFLTMNKLRHLPQFKEKSALLKEVPLGIYIYPVLQSADILLYKASDVPVGDDQASHIHLAKDIAEKFNNKFKPVFKYPKPIIYDSFASRVKSLRDPEKKMSKSDPDPKSRIELTDSPDVIRQKFKKALTDFTSEVTYDPSQRPAVGNLVALHSLVGGQTPDEVCRSSAGLETAQYKMQLADAVIEYLGPIQRRIEEYLGHPDHLNSVLSKGAEKAREIACRTLKEVKHAIGLEIT